MKMTPAIVVCGLLSGAVHAAALILSPSSHAHRVELGQTATSLQISLTTSNAAHPTKATTAPHKPPRTAPLEPSPRHAQVRPYTLSEKPATTLAVLTSKSVNSGTAQGRQSRQVTDKTSHATHTLPIQSNTSVASTSSAASLAQRRNLISRRLQRELAAFFRYPYAARRRGWQGRVVLDISIMPNGDVQRVALQRSSGHSVLDEAALATMHRITQLDWAPALLRGESIDIELPVIYQLMGG